MAEAKTKRADVVKMFHELYGRNPKDKDWVVVRYLTGKTFSDARNKLTSKAPATTAKANAGAERGNIDPLKIAQNLGYTANDFADDFVDYWETKSKTELEEALKDRGDWNDQAGRKMTPIELENEKADDDYYSSLGLSPDEISIIKGYVNDIDVNRPPSEEELKKKAAEFEDLSRKDVEDYYKDVESRDLEDLRASYKDIRNEALRYQQQEAKSYKETLAKTKQNLRARGLTFSGRSRGVLGKEGALEARGVEGELPQQRRYNWEDKRAGWQERARDIGTAAERKYGSAKLYEQRDFLNPEGLPDPYADTETYERGRTQPIYLPKKDKTQTGFVSRDQADIEKQKELEVQRRKEDRLKTYRGY